MKSLERKFYSPSEVAQMLGVSRSSVYRWIDDGLLQAYQIAYVIKIKKEDLDQFIEDGKVIIEQNG